MIRSSLSTFVVAISLLAGCGDKASTADAALRLDGRAVDAPPSNPVDAKPMPLPDAQPMPPVSPQWTAVHNEFKTLCTPCHGANGGSGGHKMGQPDALKAYMDSQLSSNICAGKKKGACASVRILDGSMPPRSLSAAERTRVSGLIDAWVAAGQP
jgi:hypothetical protein